MRLNNSVALAILAASLVCLTGSAHAAPITWTIVASASSVSLAIPLQTITITSSSDIVSDLAGHSVTASLRGFNPGPATASTPTGWTIGNSQNVSGTLQTDTDFQTYIKFLDDPSVSPNVIDGIDSGVYAPLPNGFPGTDSADFGTRLYLRSSIIFGLSIDVALRDAMYALNSDVLGTSGTLNNHTFAASGTNFGMSSSDIGFRSRNGFNLVGNLYVDKLGSGSTSLDAIATNNTAGNGSIIVTPQVGGDLATLTIPVSVPWSFSIPFGEEFIPVQGTITGTIVATAVVPEPATVGMLAVGMAMLTPMVVRRWRKRE